jgi:Complex I intermediate-associated protein 30 (CIA30)
MMRHRSLLLAPALGLFLSAAPAFPRSEDRFRVDDFEGGALQTSSGLLWMVIADDELGGRTDAHLEPVRPGASGSTVALRLSSTVRPGFAAPFAGAWAPLDREGLVVDLTGYRALRFRARGSGATFLAGFRRGTPARSANFVKAFTPTANWSSVEIDFSELSAQPPADPSLVWSPRNVGWIGFTSKAGSSGEVWLEIDDVDLVGKAEAPARESGATGSRVVRTQLSEPPEGEHLDWKPLAQEESADGRFPSLPDAKNLSYAVKGGRLWIRIDLMEKPPSDWLGVNVAIDGDGDPQDGLAWWGFNKKFHFDRLLTAYLTRSGSEYQGVVGITDAKGAEAFDLTRLGSETLSLAVDRKSSSLLLSVALRNVDSDGRFHLIATVGSPFIPNDDIPDKGFATVDLSN